MSFILVGKTTLGDRFTAQAVLEAVQVAVVVVAVELPSTQPVMVAQVDRTCEFVVVVTVPDVDTPVSHGRQHCKHMTNAYLGG